MKILKYIYLIYAVPSFAWGTYYFFIPKSQPPYFHHVWMNLIRINMVLVLVFFTLDFIFKKK